jgi:hypothetical protein
MRDNQPPELPGDEAASFESDFKKAMAEVERVKQRLAKDQPKAGPRRDSGTVRTANPPDARTENSSEQVRSIKSEPAGEFVNEIKALGSEIRIWRTESNQEVIKRRKTERWERAMATLAVIIAIFFGTATLWLNTNRQADKVGKKIEASQFVITAPSDGAEVGLGQKIRGKTPFPELNHYAVVRVVRTGSTYVRPAIASPDGTFSGEARFGDATSGEDDEFTIRVFATRATVPTGILTKAPDDAEWSDFVTVRRLESSAVTQIVIVTPADGSDGGPDGVVSGKTPVPQLNHYVVVTPTRSGPDFVQDQPASVDQAGKFTARARYGGGQVGVGEQFTVRIVATRSTLPAAPLTKVPTDAVFSNTVTVTRKY